MTSTHRARALAFLGSRGEFGAMSEEIAEHLGVPPDPNSRRIMYYLLGKMVKDGVITKTRQGKRLWRFFYHRPETQ